MREEKTPVPLPTVKTGNTLLCSLRFTGAGQRILNKVKDSRFGWNSNQEKKAYYIVPRLKIFQEQSLVHKLPIPGDFRNTEKASLWTGGG